MSTNWAKYSTAETTRQQAKEPAVQGVIALVAGDVRRVPGQTVEHTPLDENRAHTDVFGEKDEEIRLKLTRLYRWAIELTG